MGRSEGKSARIGMTGSISFHPSAEEDVRQAYIWYEEQRAGLGEDFLLCVEAALAAIQGNPHGFPAVHKEARRILLRRFPYAVFYVVNNQAVFVLAVFHCRRNPSNWMNRVSK